MGNFFKLLDSNEQKLTILSLNSRENKINNCKQKVNLLHFQMFCLLNFDLHCACLQKIPLLRICFQFSFGWLSLSSCSYAESSGLHWIAFEGELADSVAPQLLSDPLAHDSRRGALKLNLHYPHLTSLIFIALTPVTATGATARILNPARTLHSALSNPARAQM